MTTTSAGGPANRPLARPETPSTPRATTSPVVGVAVAAAIVTTLALLWAFYVDSPWKHEARDWGVDNEQGVAGLLWIVGFVVLGVGVVFGVVVRRALAGDPVRASRTALVLALVAVPLAVVVFWTGLPIVLGSAAAYLGLDARARLGRTPATAAVAIGLGLIVAATAIFFCVTG